MKFVIITSLILALSLVFLETGSSQRRRRVVVMPYDKGSARIDVSGYSSKMRRYYRVFKKRCSKCHTLARPINSPYRTKKEWKKYIIKMMRKPNSGIYPNDARKIYRFLVYDSKKRKY